MSVIVHTVYLLCNCNAMQVASGPFAFIKKITLLYQRPHILTLFGETVFLCVSLRLHHWRRQLFKIQNSLQCPRVKICESVDQTCEIIS